MLRLQLAFAVLFAFILAAIAVTPIPLPHSVAGGIVADKPLQEGHINTPNPPVVAPEFATVPDLSSLVANAVSSLQQKASQAKEALLPEIEKLKQDERAAEQELIQKEAQVELKLQPAIQKIRDQQVKFRMEASAEIDKVKAQLQDKGAAAASDAGRNFKIFESVLAPKVKEIKDSMHPLSVEIQDSAQKIKDKVSDISADASSSLKQSLAAAEKALKEDAETEMLGDHPWDAVDAEFRSDIQRMRQMFSEHAQQVTQVIFLALQPFVSQYNCPLSVSTWSSAASQRSFSNHRH
jgi:hypothetical protein